MKKTIAIITIISCIIFVGIFRNPRLAYMSAVSDFHILNSLAPKIVQFPIYDSSKKLFEQNQIAVFSSELESLPQESDKAKSLKDIVQALLNVESNKNILRDNFVISVSNSIVSGREDLTEMWLAEVKYKDDWFDFPHPISGASINDIVNLVERNSERENSIKIIEQHKPNPKIFE